MWRNKKVSVIFPTYNEKDSIRSAIEDFFASGFVDEIIVVNNNAAFGTDEEVKKTEAKIVYEKKQGYGYAIWKGLEEAEGDLLIISEPDGTFSGRDIIKLLAYSDDFNYVIGTRTTRELIWQGANMGAFLKWGNWAVAKLLEFLYNTTTLTDVGCTMRLIKRNLYEEVKPYFSIGTQHFGPELTIIIAKHKIKFIEIPVNYKPRIGQSSVTGSFRKAVVLGLKMIWLIITYRFKRLKAKR
ncbi:MAG TPA: glycosyltransferase family 2 protein [bacterium]|nr:glycosyltransferase family 2 protein [bacterium]HPO51442.1 glycosyltransferase family 2 protein [bacterium]